VGEALAREDRRRPVQALVFLGDNFYPDGVSRRTLEERVRENLAGPYCHFLWLTQRGRRALRDHCDRPDAETHPIPLIAVLGNHDVGRRRSPELQRNEVPRFIGNWLMAEGAHSYELGEGVSLVAYDSTLVEGGRPATALARALAVSAGPWRILAAHHPVADSGAGFRARDANPVLEAIAAAGKPVHLALAGHQHSLQALRAPGAALHVISGSGGASLREPSPARAERLYVEARYGFARVDVTPEALEVTFFALAGPLDRSAEPRARFRIAPDGAVSALEVGGGAR
jgi:3',5'-cyclic AMP phosphodiesterase CpdA